MFVLCCAYHVHDKMSPRCFLVFLWISLDTMVVGIIMFLWFWNIMWLCVLTLCPNLHTLCFWCTHTHTLWHVWVVNVTILSCIDELCLYMSILGGLHFKFLFLGLWFNTRCVGTTWLLIKFVIIFCALFCGTCCFIFTSDSKEENHCTTHWQKEENGQYLIPLYPTLWEYNQFF